MKYKQLLIYWGDIAFFALFPLLIILKNFSPNSGWLSISVCFLYLAFLIFAAIRLLMKKDRKIRDVMYFISAILLLFCVLPFAFPIFENGSYGEFYAEKQKQEYVVTTINILQNVVRSLYTVRLTIGFYKIYLKQKNKPQPEN